MYPSQLRYTRHVLSEKDRVCDSDIYIYIFHYLRAYILLCCSEKISKHPICVYQVFYDMKVVPDHCEGRGASSQSRASFHSHMGNQNNTISRNLLIFSVLLKEPKNGFFLMI